MRAMPAEASFFIVSYCFCSSRVAAETSGSTAASSFMAAAYWRASNRVRASLMALSSLVLAARTRLASRSAMACLISGVSPQLVFGGLLHGGFQRRNCLLIFFFREQALSLFGGSIHAASLVKVGIFIAGQLEEALDLSRAFDLGSGSLQDLDRADKILLAASF